MRLLRGLVAAAVAVLPALAIGPTPAAALTGGSCAWYLTLNDSGANALFLDQNVTYWVTRVPYAPGESLTLRGQFPHSRYMSVTAYDPRTRAVSSLYDAQIQPDAGSSNPFVAGASRQASSRSWTMKVAFLQPGQQPSAAPNTLSTGFVPGGAAPASDFFLVYRVYLPDRGRDQAGGAPLPTVFANVPPAPEQAFPACPAGPAPPGALNDAVAATAAPASLPPDPGTPEPAWHKFYNFPTSAAQSPDSTGKTSFAGTVTPYTMKTGSGGYLEDLENAYLYTFLNQGGGPLTVIHAQALTFPNTYDGLATMPPPADVRYWSVCSYDPATQRNVACSADFQAAPSGGGYTIVVSTAANKPAQLCGATWLPYGPNLQSLLIFRNQLGTAPYTVQNVQLGQETAMGAFYPAARYMDQAAYGRQVCGVSDDPGAPPASGGGDSTGRDGSASGVDGAFTGDLFGGTAFLPADVASGDETGPPADAAPSDATAGDPAGAPTDQPPSPGAVLAAHGAHPPVQNPALAAALGALVIGVLGIAVRRRLLAA